MNIWDVAGIIFAGFFAGLGFKLAETLYERLKHRVKKITEVPLSP